MYGAILAILVTINGSTPSLDPATLVAELGSARFAQREAAAAALAQQGRGAIQALLAAESHRDPEVRTRAAAILLKIEADLLVEPTMIDLAFNDQPLIQVLGAINQQAGLHFKLNPDIPAFWADRRVSIRSPQPLPFWKALDVLCEAGQLHHVFGGQNEFDQEDSSIVLYDGFAAQQGVFDDRGPFRVQLASLHYQSEVHLSSARGNPREFRSGATLLAPSPRSPNQPSKQFFMQLLVGAEPRLTLAPGGSIKVTEAIDDQGRSLVLPPQGEVIQHESGYLGVVASPLVHLRLDLAYPDGPVTQLKRVRGTIPLVVSTRKPDPLEIPLDQAMARTFRQNGVAISIGEIHLNQPDQPPTIELSIKTEKTAIHPTEGDDADAEIRSVASPQQLEVLDAAGRMIPWFPSNSFFNGQEAKMTLALLDRGGPVVPTTIRYHSIVRDRTEVPFEFRDVPMP